MRALPLRALALLLCALALLLCAAGAPASASAQSYVRATTNAGVPTRWYTKCVHVYLNAAGSATLSRASVEGALQGSLDAWSAVGCADLSLIYEGLTERSEVGYVTTAGVQNINQVVFEQLWRHSPAALALTTLTMCQNSSTQCPAGTIVDADIEVNEQHYTFATNGAASAIDLQNTLTHEVGHLIGFDHTSSSSSTMYAAAPPGETSKRTLSPLDEQGACAVYPPASCLTCELGPLDLSERGAGVPRAPSCDAAAGGQGGGAQGTQGTQSDGCAQQGRGAERRPSPLGALWGGLLCAALALRARRAPRVARA